MDLLDWFRLASKQLAIHEVREIPLHESKDWNIRHDSEGRPIDIGHVSGAYYRGIALQLYDPLLGKFSGRFMLTPVLEKEERINGVILLFRNRQNGKFLIQAKAEPGNMTPGRVVLTSTIQASWTNIRQGLSGKIPFMDLYHHDWTVKCDVPQDGGQFFEKVNQICFLDCSAHVIPSKIPETFAWFGLDEIKGYAERGLVSEHLLQALGLFFLNS